MKKPFGVEYLQRPCQNIKNAENIRKMFDSIAPEYDRLNHLLSLNVDRRWRKRALKEIFSGCPISEARRRVLDLACGTGDFSIEIAKYGKRVMGGEKGYGLTSDLEIIGLDLSQGMLDIMNAKVADLGLGDVIHTIQGNSECMPFEDDSFDAVSIGFGIRNFEHREDALKEILRVLKPGGRLVILELSVPESSIIRWGYNLYFKHVLPLIGRRISGDDTAYSYLPASVLKFPGKKEWMAIMRSCGYANVTHKALSLGICRMYTGDKFKEAGREAD